MGGGLLRQLGGLLCGGLSARLNGRCQGRGILLRNLPSELVSLLTC